MKLFKNILLLFALTNLTACQEGASSTVETHKQPVDDKSVSAASNAGQLRTTAFNELRNAYFGETHMHTAYSLDAYLGGTRLTPDDAYRYAKGETVSLEEKSLARGIEDGISV